LRRVKEFRLGLGSLVREIMGDKIMREITLK
jgi:hypothetical protein